MKKLITQLLAVVMIFSSFAAIVPAASADDSIITEENLLFNFEYAPVYGGVVDGKATAKAEQVTEDGRVALKVVPTPDDAQSSKLALDCYKLKFTKEDLENALYMTIDYKYTGEEDLPNMYLEILKTGGLFKSEIHATAQTETVKDEWSTAVFDISSARFSLSDEEGKIFKQFHFYPYGNEVNSFDAKTASPDQVMYIGKISFYGIDTQQGPTSNATGIIKGEEEPLIAFNYIDEFGGVVDDKTTATVERVVEDGMLAAKIQATPDIANGSSISLDAYHLERKFKPEQFKNARYLTIDYKYEKSGNGAKVNKMHVEFTTLGGGLTSTIKADSLNPVISDGWQTAIFDVSKFDDYVTIADGKIIRQMHFWPFGDRLSPVDIGKDQVMYIGEVRLYEENPDTSATYTVSFRKGYDDATGEDPAVISVMKGDKFTLPEQNYTIQNAISSEFLGWRYSEDGMLYQPGTEFTAIDGYVTFTAMFEVEKLVPNVRTIPFAQYQGGSVNNNKSAEVTNTVFQDKEVTQVIVNPKDESTMYGVKIDGYHYDTAGIDLSIYKHMVVTYFLDGELPMPTTFAGEILSSGGVLTKAYMFTSKDPMVSGKWAYATVDLTGIDSYLNPSREEHFFKQMHLQVFKGISTKLKGTEKLYIADLMFFKEKPQLELHESYMKGYDGNLFKPQNTMTRAEAATIVARLCAGGDTLVPTDKVTAFTDVASHWGNKYISYVESLGYLKAYSGAFLPDQPITRAEFVELVYNMGLLADAGKNGTFTDVAANHPRATVISAAGKAGLVNGYDNGNGTFSFKPDATITRAEVVKVINNAYKRSITADKLSSDLRAFFSDVSADFWAYPEIAEATVSHIDSPDGWVLMTVSPTILFGGGEVDYAAAENYLKELDTLAANRIAEIRNTPTTVQVTGTKYYVSNNGNDEADGKSPATAWKTIAKVVSAGGQMVAGDGVFFERGSVWRESLSVTVSGVTYSAYGEGAKPRIYASPENGVGAEKWSLMPGTTNIWVYYKDLKDCGGIYFEDANGVKIGYKETPQYINEFFCVYGSNGSKLFDIKTELDKDLDFYCELPAKTIGMSTGKLYVRSDAGNPGTRFNSIEFFVNQPIIKASGDNITFDNLCLMYGGIYGISAGSIKGLTVTNCEMGWIGGSITYYNANGGPVRVGNGVEIYGSCDGFVADNNYIYQCYDTGLTHQYSAGGGDDISHYNITYSNNVIEDCIYNIEYFNGASQGGNAVRDGKNFLIEGNILRRAGYGWGIQRSDGNVSCNIKSWEQRNQYESGTFIIRNNIFDRGSWNLVETCAENPAWAPIYENNTYMQVIDRGLGRYKEFRLTHDKNAEIAIKNDFGDKNAKVYILPEAYAPAE